MMEAPATLPTKAKLLSTLADLACLPDDWDSYGARVLDADIIEAARKLLLALPDGLALPTIVAPLSCGSVQFEWHCGPKVLELEFETAETIAFLRWHPDEGMEDEGAFAASDVERIAGHIRWFMREDKQP